MNIMEKIEMEAKLKENLAGWMIEHGTILYDKSQSNAYAYVRIMEILWRELVWRIVEVDGMVCRLKKV